MKEYDQWDALKKRLNARKNPPDFNMRDVWWLHLGVNIGDEEDGKGEFARRPVLVYKKYNRRTFLAIPLSTKIKEYNPNYHKLEFHCKEQSAIINQMRLVDNKRLLNKMGRLSEEQFFRIKAALLQSLA